MNTHHLPALFLPAQFGWMFALIAAVFALGLSPRLARRFYPEAPLLRRRLAAPVIFAALAAACFLGAGFPALAVVAALGLAQITVGRRRRPNTTPSGDGT